MDVDELLLRESMDVIGPAPPSLLTLRARFEGSHASQRTCESIVHLNMFQRVLRHKERPRALNASSSVLAAQGPGEACNLTGHFATGRFGFQKDMGAIASLWRPESEANHNVRALLESTEEVVARTKTFMRWWQLWRPDVVAGWVTLGRFKARSPLCCSTCHPSARSACSHA